MMGLSSNCPGHAGKSTNEKAHGRRMMLGDAR